MFPGVGALDMPSLAPETCGVTEFIGFHCAKSCKNPQDKGIHFFIGDYQFSRLWTNPDAYIDLLKKFQCVFTPDFSIYADFPRAIQMYNHYRKHWLGAYWQTNGLRVIPSISWSDESSFAWCFDGEPEGSVVAVSSVGTQKSAAARALFLAGYEEMLRRLHPSKILFYGVVPEACSGSIVPISAYYNELKARCCGKESVT